MYPFNLEDHISKKKKFESTALVICENISPQQYNNDDIEINLQIIPYCS